MLLHRYRSMCKKFYSEHGFSSRTWKLRCGDLCIFKVDCYKCAAAAPGKTVSRRGCDYSRDIQFFCWRWIYHPRIPASTKRDNFNYKCSKI